MPALPVISRRLAGPGAGRALLGALLAPALAAAPVVDTGPAGLHVAGPAQAYELRLRANAQVDVRSFGSERLPAVDTLLFRRLSVNLEGRVGRQWAFRLMPDFARSRTNLLDAYAAFRPGPAFNLLAGKTKSPLDPERLVSQTDLLFIERGATAGLAPNRDVGVQASGSAAGGAFTWQAGWLAGARDNDSATTVIAPPRDLVARLLWRPFQATAGSAWRGLALGLAGSRGERSSDVPNGYRTHAQQRFFAWRSTVVNDGVHARLEPQAMLYAGSFGVMAAWVQSRQALLNTATGSARSVAARAWQLAVHWVVTGEDAGNRGVTPAQSFRRGGWGAFELAARIDGLAIARGAFPDFADPATSARRARGGTLGCNWYLSPALKASLNLEHTAFTGGERGPVARADERALLAQLQLRY